MYSKRHATAKAQEK